MHRYKRLLQGLLVEWLKTYRASHNITQESMAEQMNISPRSYSDLERGVFCISAVALMLFLLMLSEGEVLRFLREFRMRIKGAEQNVVA